jgi:hypothetical protein
MIITYWLWADIFEDQSIKVSFVELVWVSTGKFITKKAEQPVLRAVRLRLVHFPGNPAI